jgi:uncharacterized RDD family membrane protein YckC
LEELYLASTWRRLGAFTIDLILGGSLVFCVWYFLKSPVLSVLIFYSYFVLSYRILARTLGKWFLGLYVVGYDGRKRLSWTRCFIRGFIQIVSPLFSLIPQILALFREDRKQLADLLAGTQVMQKKPRMRPPRVRKKIAIGWILIFLSLSGFLVFSFKDLLQ